MKRKARFLPKNNSRLSVLLDEFRLNYALYKI